MIVPILRVNNLLKYVIMRRLIQKVVDLTGRIVQCKPISNKPLC